MNTQAAIEAAKIAAETAARNALITTIVAVITLLITSGISIWSVMRNSKITKELGEKNLKSAEQKRYIDAISVERVKWINTMRDNFSQYIKLIHFQMIDMDNVKLYGTHTVDEKKMDERFVDIVHLGNHIYLLLNPTEPITIKIVSQQNLISEAFDADASKFDYKSASDLMQDVGYLYQVVLKAEWKRVKRENEIGEEMDEKAVNEIYTEAAKKISKEKYEQFFKGEERKSIH